MRSVNLCRDRERLRYLRRGDLYVTFIVEEDKTFIRNGNDVYVEVPVFFTQAYPGITTMTSSPSVALPEMMLVPP